MVEIKIYNTQINQNHDFDQFYKTLEQAGARMVNMDRKFNFQNWLYQEDEQSCQVLYRDLDGKVSITFESNDSELEKKLLKLLGD
jgi:hypothetical protein